METGYRNFNETEMSISIKDLFMRICLKWRLMIVCALIFAILFNAIGILKSYRAVQNQAKYEEEKNNIDVQIENSLTEIEQIKAQLNEREIADVDRAIENYVTLNEQYTKSMDYYRDSIRMQINANYVPTLTLQYNIDTHYEVEYPIVEKTDYTDSIESAFCNLLTSDEICSELQSKIYPDTKTTYVKELLNVYGVANNLCIIIIAPSKSDCEEMGRIIDEYINKGHKELEKVFGDFELKKTVESFGESANAAILNEQTIVINNINGLRSSISSLTYGMTDIQRNYYTALLKYDSLINGAVEDTDVLDSNLDKREVELTIQYINIKMMIVGVIFGVFIACMFVAINYILSGKLRTAVDMEKMYGLRNLGIIYDKRKKNYIDELVKLIFEGKKSLEPEKQIEIICAEIRISAQKKGLQNLYITGSSVGEETEKIYAEVCKNLEKVFEKVEYGMSILANPDSMQKMAEADGVILIEKIDSSIYNDMKKEIEITIASQTPIVGSVVIE